MRKEGGGRDEGGRRKEQGRSGDAAIKTKTPQHDVGNNRK